MADTQQERIDALSKFLASTDTGARRTAPARVELTGNVIEAGGDVERILITSAQLTYSAGNPPVMHYPKAGPGDVVLVTARQAERLDSLGVTVESEADLGDVNAALEVEAATGGAWDDERIRAAKAEEVVAYVTQNPDERARVRAIEEERSAKKRRKTILDATEPTPLTDADALAEAAGLEEEPPIEENEPAKA